MGTAQDHAGGEGFRIVIVEDDRVFRETLCLELAARGCRVVEFGDAADALARLVEGVPADGMVLSGRLAEAFEGDPWAELAAARLVLPIVILADPGEWRAANGRWRAVGVLDRSRSVAAICEDLIPLVEGGGLVGAAPARPIATAADDLVFDQEARRAFWRGRQLDLTEPELVLLHGLAGPAGGDLTYLRARGLLQAAAVAGGAIDRELFRSLVKRLRKKFREVDPDFDRIAFVPERGYRWRGSAAGVADPVIRPETEGV